MIQRVLVLGGGSAGFLAALTLKVRLPHLAVTVLRSKDIGIIGVGEGTTAIVPKHLHGVLKIDVPEFWREADPVPKLGIRYLTWGPRPYFDYVFGFQFNYRFLALSHEVGYYCDEEVADASVTAALMSRNLAFVRGQDGRPVFARDLGYHLENERFVALLEKYVRRAGIPITDDTVDNVITDERGVKELKLASGATVSADLFLDCSGFRSVLLGKAMQEPFVSYKSTLYCDKAVVGGWDRGPGEPIQPYTTAETMEAGWCWRIDHTHRINRGYVFASGFISDEQAEREFRSKNPKVTKTRVVPFVSGRYRNAWVKNVVGIGNAIGFVEPLEATAIGVICAAADNLAEVLICCGGRMRPTAVDLFNRFSERQWEQIRRFLSVHYKFNTRFDTPFWIECRQNIDLAGTDPIIEFYRENGPTALWRNVLNDPNDSFGAEGYLSMFVGQKVTYQHDWEPSEQERSTWADIRRWIASQAKTGFSVLEAARIICAATARPAPAPVAPFIAQPMQTAATR